VVVRGYLLRPLWLGVVALWLGACTRDPYVGTYFGGGPAKWAGKWRVATLTDRVTAAPFAAAVLDTRNSSNSEVTFPQPATMEVACFRNKPIIRFAFAFKIGTTRNAEFAYRFDDKPGRVADARITLDHTFLVVEDEGAVRLFINEMTGSQTLYMHVRTINAGRSSAEFELEGARIAVDAALAGCPVKPTATPPRTAKLSAAGSAH
jgi:hypothetical protein